MAVISLKSGHLLGRLMDFFSLPYSVPEKRQEHYVSNSLAWSEYRCRNFPCKENPKQGMDQDYPFVENQFSGMDAFLYGNQKLSVNGCAPIAIYNSLLALSWYYSPSESPSLYCPSLPDIILNLETLGLVASGKMGTSPNTVLKCIKTLNNRYICRGIYLSKNSNPEFKKMEDEHSSFILLCLSNGNRLSGGLHYVSVHRGGSTLHLHNGALSPLTGYGSLSDILDALKEKSLPFYIIGISISKEH